MMYVHRAMKSLRCDTNEGILLIVKIFLVSSWAGSPFLCLVFSKVLLSVLPFCPAQYACLSCFRLCSLTGGKDNQDKELTETMRKIYSEPKFSIGQDFPKGVLSYIRRYSWKEFIWKMLRSS